MKLWGNGVVWKNRVIEKWQSNAEWCTSQHASERYEGWLRTMAPTRSLRAHGN